LQNKSNPVYFLDKIFYFNEKARMNQTDMDQIRNVINNFAESKEYIPFFHDLLDHPVFGPVFKTLKSEEIDIVNEIINELIREKISKLKTKWGQLFRRFFDNNEDMFWDFRLMNEHHTMSNSREFQNLWKKVETEMFRLEWILTQWMMKKAQWLGKTVDAFYSIIYTFFPLYWEIE